MATPIDMTARIHLILEIDRPGPEMEQLAEGVHTVGIRIAEVNQIQNIQRTTMQSSTASVRYLLLNLRMFSFGMRTLRRQFGDTNPALEQFTNSLMTLAAIGTSVVAGTTLITGAMARLTPILAGVTFGTLIGGAKILIGLLGGPVGVAAALLTIVAIPISGWVMDSVSGIHTLRQEAKGLEFDLKMLESQLKTLSAEQDKFNLGMSATQIEMRKLKRAIDLAGGSNKELEAQLAALTAEYENMSIANMEATLRQRELRVVQTDAKVIADDLLRLESARRQARSRMGGFIGEETIFEAMKLQDITKGRPTWQALGAAAGGERRPGGLGPTTGSPSVTINFPGAVFNTEGDIEGALQAGAVKASRILYNQYSTSGAQR